MIALGCDHGGYELKEEIKKYLDEIGIEYKDFGTYSNERTDYPIYAEKVAKSVQSKECESGILICKTGFGMTIVANKFKGIRCAPCYDVETAKQAKEHSNINILSLPASYVNISKAVQIIRVWIASEFLSGRYADRLQMIEEIEKENMK
jgi:ribose 5-phosphate isomerase B